MSRCKETYCVDLCSLQKGSFNLVIYMMFQIFFMTFRNESEHCISNKTKLTYKCLSRMEEQSHQQYDNTSNYGKKNDVMESCPEFNEDHILFQQFLQKKQP